MRTIQKLKFKIQNYNSKIKIFFILFVALASIGLLQLKPNTKVQKQSLEVYAQEIVQTCLNASYKPSCYEKEVPKLLEKISMEDAFRVTTIVQDKDKEYTYCHVLGHELSALETKKDPDKWKQVIARCPSGVCSNGCIHGAFQERFRTESLPDAKITELKTELEGVCETRTGFSPTPLEQATCYHALGHLTMYITGANFEKSLALCEQLAKKTDGRDLSPLCFDGAFMQIYQPLEPEDFALIKGREQTKDTVEKFCSVYSEQQHASCWSESWPLFWQDISRKPMELIAFCSHLDETLQRGCYTDLFYVITAQFNFDETKLEPYCLQLPQTIKGQCFANASSRMIETDYRNIEKSVKFCQKAPDGESRKACFDELVMYAAYNFHNGSAEQKTLCSSLPEPWKSRCP